MSWNGRMVRAFDLPDPDAAGRAPAATAGGPGTGRVSWSRDEPETDAPGERSEMLSDEDLARLLAEQMAGRGLGSPQDYALYLGTTEEALRYWGLPVDVPGEPWHYALARTPDSRRRVGWTPYPAYRPEGACWLDEWKAGPRKPDDVPWRGELLAAREKAAEEDS